MSDQIIHEVTGDLIKKVKEANKGAKLSQIELDLDDGRSFQCIARKPTNASITRYINKLSQATRQNKDTQQIHAQFVYDNILAPTAEELLQIVETRELPLLPVSIADELAEGSGIATSSKKKLL